MSASSVGQENRNSPPFPSPLPGPAPDTWTPPACTLFALNGFISFLKGWAPLSQEKGRGMMSKRQSSGIMSRTSMVVGPGILHSHAFQLPPLHQVSFRSSNCHLQSHEHPTGCIQSWHSKKSPQVQGEPGRTTPPQVKFKGLLQCLHFQSVLDKGGNLSLRSHFCLSCGQWGGCACAHVFQSNAQRAVDALQNICHLFCGDTSYCKIREEIIQKFSLRQPDIISLSPRKN